METQGVIGAAKVIYLAMFILPINLLIAAKLVKLKIFSIFSALWRPFFFLCDNGDVLTYLDHFLKNHRQLRPFQPC